MDRAFRPMLPTAAVGSRIRQRRVERNLTQVELARQIGIQQSDLSRMEKGEYRVSLDVLFRLLQAFELSLGEFFGDLNAGSLTDRESVLLESFRSLPPEVQEEVLEFAAFKRQRWERGSE
ncbi:MAG: helix-turn-helix transcriptional regulator [Thermoanaerobaculaceae bacterium]|nr:helix-turn-helix transcriptional regulator [Thermoanaerobaculaceae bacterium]MDI9623117.1 helix-turn-helix transcriptional regulator [Acidobacteriota bacterium]NLH11332.1 helix-turn-helix transcriptional regulator [Holophagae bacterium]HPW56576.1 helix-turn-helix transcriptional regulator [Thermoanaerobaculaceae bacterium]